jgi:uncharacterized membrane protein YeiH
LPSAAASVAAIGGGTLRDILLNRHPVFWIRDPKYLYTILAATALTVLCQNYFPSLETALLVADAFGLGLCALSGARIAEASDQTRIVVILMGTMTGVTGGVMRDLLSGVIPVLLRRDIYATAAIAGICLYLLMQRAGVKRSWAFVAGIVSVVAVRLLAITFGWQLPI